MRPTSQRPLLKRFLALLLILGQAAWTLPAHAQNTLRPNQEAEAKTSGLEEKLRPATGLEEGFNWTLANTLPEIPKTSYSDFLVREVQVRSAGDREILVYFSDHHEAAYFLLERIRAQGPFALLNFDAHTDYGDAADPLDLGTWGAHGQKDGLISRFAWVYPPWYRAQNMSARDHEGKPWPYDSCSAGALPEVEGPVAVSIDMDYFSAWMDHVATPEEMERNLEEIVRVLEPLRDRIAAVIVARSPGWTDPSAVPFLEPKIQAALERLFVGEPKAGLEEGFEAMLANAPGVVFTREGAETSDGLIRFDFEGNVYLRIHSASVPLGSLDSMGALHVVEAILSRLSLRSLTVALENGETTGVSDGDLGARLIKEIEYRVGSAREEPVLILRIDPRARFTPMEIGVWAKIDEQSDPVPVTLLLERATAGLEEDISLLGMGRTIGPLDVRELQRWLTEHQDIAPLTLEYPASIDGPEILWSGTEGGPARLVINSLGFVYLDRVIQQMEDRFPVLRDEAAWKQRKRGFLEAYIERTPAGLRTKSMVPAESRNRAVEAFHASGADEIERAYAALVIAVDFYGDKVNTIIGLRSTGNSYQRDSGRPPGPAASEFQALSRQMLAAVEEYRTGEAGYRASFAGTEVAGEMRLVRENVWRLQEINGRLETLVRSTVFQEEVAGVFDERAQPYGEVFVSAVEEVSNELKTQLEIVEDYLGAAGLEEKQMLRERLLEQWQGLRSAAPEMRTVVIGPSVAERFPELKVLAEMEERFLVDDGAGTVTRLITQGAGVVNYYGEFEEAARFTVLANEAMIQVEGRLPTAGDFLVQLEQILLLAGIPQEVLDAGLEEFVAELGTLAVGA